MYPHITESYPCIPKIFAVIFLLPIFCYMLKSKAIEIRHIITIHIESSNEFLLIYTH